MFVCDLMTPNFYIYDERTRSYRPAPTPEPVSLSNRKVTVLRWVCCGVAALAVVVVVGILVLQFSSADLDFNLRDVGAPASGQPTTLRR